MKVALVLPDDAPGVPERVAAATARGLRRAGHVVESFARWSAPAPFPGHPGRDGIGPLYGPLRSGARFDGALAFGARALVAGAALDAGALVHVALEVRSARRPSSPSEEELADRILRGGGAARLATPQARRPSPAAPGAREVQALPVYVDETVYGAWAPADRVPLHVWIEGLATSKEARAFAQRAAQAAPGLRLWFETPGAAPAAGRRSLPFIDAPPGDARPGLLAACDVFVATVPWTGDVPILEAMGTGLVVVAEEGAGSPGLLRDGENGLVFPSRHADRAAVAIARVAGDAALRARLRAGALATARARSAAEWEPIAVAAVLDSLACGRRPSPEDRREAAAVLERTDGERAATAGTWAARTSGPRAWLRRLRRAPRSAVGGEAESRADPPPRPLPDPPRGAGEPEDHVLFCGPPDYFRSAWADAVRDGWGTEHAVRAHDGGSLDRLPEVARRAGARTCVAFDPWHLAGRPEVLAALRGDGVRVVAFSSEPVPRSADRRVHWDALRRFGDYRRARDAGYDLWIHYDPSSAEFLEGEGFRPLAVHPLPVSEHLFHPADVPRDVDVCFLGWSTPRREAFLEPLKARLKTVHVAHGFFDEDAQRLMNRSKVVLNLHAHEFDNFETRCVQALFCGRPLVSEEVSGGYLVPERDYLLARTPAEALARVREAMDGGGPLGSGARFDRRRFLAASLRDLLRATRQGRGSP